MRAIAAHQQLTELSRLGGFGEVSALRTLSPYPVGRHYRGVVAAASAAVILGGGWLGSSSLRRLRSRIPVTVHFTYNNASSA
jgi:hypothetical protein